ncbi:PDZ domain-containing protein [Halosegnis marinus]|uniref:PDZ domain-containing protein n=1 Tax=Halosegnis marinus TaxID=3034023 RepID=UPI00361DAAFB
MYCRVAGIGVERVGIALLAVVPAGAFVQPDRGADESRGLAGWARMYAAGPTANVVLGALCLLLLVGPVLGSVGVAPGLAVGGVFDGAPAAEAGIAPGDRLLAVNGTAVTDGDSLDAALAAAGARVRVETDDGTATVERAVTVVRSDGPYALPDGTRIGAVNGTAVATEAGFRAAARDHPVARLTTRNGTLVRPLGLAGTTAQGARSRRPASGRTPRSCCCRSTASACWTSRT